MLIRRTAASFFPVPNGRWRSAVASASEAALPTPLSLGSNVVYHRSHGHHHGAAHRRPLAVVAGWMGAKPHQMKSYLKFYHDLGMDTLSFAVGPQHVLFPSHATAQMERVLELCIAPTPQETRPPPALAFHMFSVGGFCYGQMLRVISAQPRFAHIPQLTAAQVFDSTPDMDGIPKGVSRSMGVGAPWDKAIELSLDGYIAATARTSVGRGHRAASDAFHGNVITAPALWFYSKADRVADWERCALVANKWRSRGAHVEECVWDHTPHIQHGRIDPDRYFGTLKNFFEKRRNSLFLTGGST
jgi:hypothetical protein